VQSKVPGHQPGQSREHGTVSPVRPRARDLPRQHRDLVPQYQDLCFLLAPLRASSASQPNTHREQVDEADEHEPERKAADQTVRRILAQHTPP